MKRFIKHLVLLIVLLAGSIALGSYTITVKESALKKKSSYDLTEFSYVVLNPSKSQIEEFRANKEAVKDIFPVYNFAATISAKNTSKVNLLLSDQIQYYETGLFNNKTIRSGSFDASGIMVDETAANKLGVKVGDKVSTSLGQKQFEFEVKAVYLPSNYRGLDSGVALASFSEQIKNAFAKELAYDYAFISSSNDTACKAMLANYIPLGSLKSEAQFIADSKASTICPPGISDEEWTAALKVEYQTYKANYLSQDYSDSIQDKATFKQHVYDQTQSKEKQVTTICIISPIAIVVVYTSLFILLTVTNKERDITKHRDGEASIGAKYISFAIISSLLAMLASFGVLVLVASFKAFFLSYIGIMLCFSVPLIGSTIFIVPLTSKLYLSNFKNKK